MRMKVTKEQVEHVALLARLKLSEEERKKMTDELNQILEHFEKLGELDTENIEPTSHVLPLENILREDTLKPSLKREEALSNAPERSSACFKVPPVIEF